MSESIIRNLIQWGGRSELCQGAAIGAYGIELTPEQIEKQKADYEERVKVQAERDKKLAVVAMAEQIAIHNPPSHKSDDLHYLFKSVEKFIDFSQRYVADE